MDWSDRELLFLLRLPGVGPARVRTLVERFHDLASVLRAGTDDLAAAAGLSQQAARVIAHAASGPAAERIRHWVDTQLGLLARKGARLVTLWQSEYPAGLREIHDAPPLLFVRGSLVPDDRRAVAVVGTRTMTSYGREVAEHIARGLAGQGFTVVSGLARGIDTVAHSAALAGGGRTLAVIGSGIDRLYPPENATLAERVAVSGALLSECTMGEKPLRFHFPRRNRIISGLALATIVVESGPAGGAMITAAFTLDQERMLFAVPSNVDIRRPSGTNLLIKEGRALLLETLDDLTRELAGWSGTLGNLPTPEPPRV